MPPIVRFALPARRRAMIDSLPAPRVRLRDSRPHDSLDGARGVLNGVIAGMALWAAIVGAWFIWS